MVCAADELAPGDMVPARLDGTPIVVVRTRDGELHGLVDRCVHQGARLSGGRLLPGTDGERAGEYRLSEDDARRSSARGTATSTTSAPAARCSTARRRLRRVDVRVEDGLIVAG